MLIWLAAIAYSPENLRAALGRRHGGLSLVLENVRKENVGLIARTAEALGVPKLHLIYTADKSFDTRSFAMLSTHAQVVTLSKISKSATDWLSIRMHSSVDACVAALREEGTLLVATTPDMDGALDLYDSEGDADWAVRDCALLFGSEQDGLSDELLRRADVRVTVPQRGLVQSLNVAACAALVLGEVTRRRARPGCEIDLSEAEVLRLQRELHTATKARRRSKGALKAEARAQRTTTVDGP
jgi:tRNA (guanosine-2'-O-)-methyltransferase